METHPGLPPSFGHLAAAVDFKWLEHTLPSPLPSPAISRPIHSVNYSGDSKSFEGNVEVQVIKGRG